MVAEAKLPRPSRQRDAQSMQRPFPGVTRRRGSSGWRRRRAPWRGEGAWCIGTAVCVCVCVQPSRDHMGKKRGCGGPEGWWVERRRGTDPSFCQERALVLVPGRKVWGNAPRTEEADSRCGAGGDKGPVAPRGGRELATGEGDEELTTPLRLSRIWWPSWAFRVLLMPRLCEMGAPCMLEVLRWNQREGSSHARNCMYSGERVFVGNGSESLMCFSAARR